MEPDLAFYLNSSEKNLYFLKKIFTVVWKKFFNFFLVCLPKKKTNFSSENSFLWLLEKTKNCLYLILIIVKCFFLIL